MAHPPSMVVENVAAIRDRIEVAAKRAGRRASEVILVGISKSVPAERIREAFEAGVQHFGANRVQEWESKAPHLESIGATWHFVGHLQRNKATKAVQLFHTIDSVDSLPLAEKLDHAVGEGRRLPVLIEVRLDPAAAKSGCDPAVLPRLAEGVLLLPHLELRGLMSVPAPASDSREARPFFSHLRELRDQLASHLDWPLRELSMGMSHDFDVAIEEGATQIRVGTALFSNRIPAK
ncbi:MAG: YggS family pyridoxal phosphate-dependent enzyme [Terracidiphilus sp.]